MMDYADLQEFLMSAPVEQHSDVIATNFDNYKILFKEFHGRDPYTLRNPWTGEVYWIEGWW